MEPAKTPTERRRESPRSLLPLLLGLAAVLGGLLAWEQWADLSGGAPQKDGSAPVVTTAMKGKPAALAPDSEAGAGSSAASAHALASLAVDDLGDTVRRPLFEKKRRPVEPPKTVAAPVAPAVAPKRQADPNALTLQGIVVNEGRSAIALMRRTQTGQSVRLEEGDTVDGWTVERIEAERVQLVQGDTRIALQLFRKR